MSIHRIILIAGLPGSGKSTTSEFFRQSAYSVVRMGVITDMLIKGNGGILSEENEKKVRDRLRETYGDDVYAMRVVPIIRRLLEGGNRVVVEGVRTLSELNHFRTQLDEIFLIYLEVSEKERYRRLAGRINRPLSLPEAKRRDNDEIYKLRVPDLKAHADMVIENNGSLLHLYSKLKKIINC